VILLDEYVVLIGAHGWLHKAWKEEFYPDDLPREWQLGFYANEFPVVILPASYWYLGKEAVKEWLEETDELPQFICEWPANLNDRSEADHIIEMLDILAPRILGIVFMIDGNVDEMAQSYFEILSAKFLVTVDIINGNRDKILESLDAIASGKEVGLCWHGEEALVDNLALGKLALIRINDQELPPKELRRVLESCTAASKPDRSVALIFDGSPPEIKQMVSAGVMLDLL